MLKDLVIKNYLKARSLVYFAESLPVIGTQKLLSKSFGSYALSPENLEDLQIQIDEIFAEDAKNFAKSIYPLKLLKPEPILKHSKRFLDILADNIFVSIRKKQKKAKVFSSKLAKDLKKLPDYYQRNFHFQTDGYLSEDSAERYEHQVEILFKGTSQTMRRSFIPLLKKHISTKSHKNVLELACGTGSASYAFLSSFENINLTCCDISDFYLKKARENLNSFKNVNFVCASGEDLPFKDEFFDIHFSVYLFHELPFETRLEVLKEAYRTLNKGGLLVVTDSIQLGDNKKMDWAILDFPKNFHEPYYRDYISKPIEDSLKDCGFEILETKVCFLTKSIVAKKIA